jgi:hypothetical protein
MRLIIDIDLGEVPTGLRIADAIWAIQKTLEPIKQELLRGNELDKMPQQGEILDENNLDELIGAWRLQPEPSCDCPICLLKLQEREKKS